MNPLRRTAVLLGVALSATTTLAAEPPLAPIIRIDGGMHNAVVRRIAVDRSGQLLATASEDKTVRVWEIATGRLLQVLRLPQGAFQEGRAYSVAISPDGELIAAGGWTCFEWDRTNCIYVFHRTSGRLVRRYGGIPGVINSLDWSPDGRYIAAVTGYGAGLRVFRADSTTLVGSDSINDVSHGVRFDGRGRLFTTSYDGYLRVYQVSDAGVTLQHRQPFPAGAKQPFAIDISPDGRLLAVGYADAPRVDVFSSSDLSFLYSANTAGVPADKSFGAVAWSADGQKLYGGGSYRNSENNLMRIWDDAGRGAYRDVAASPDLILHILRLPGGGVAYGAAGPVWGTINAAGARSMFVLSSTADFRDNFANFRISDDGMTIAFSYLRNGAAPARFNAAKGVLQFNDVAAGLTLPRSSAPGLDLRDWRGTPRPSVNGKTLELGRLERAMSVAVAPDNQSFLLGGDYSLYRYRADGTRLWSTSVPGVAWTVNVSGDGKVAVAALSDGTIRWYRYGDGKELLAFFPHSDRNRWVAWTPSGYYDVSPGAEDLIGWHLNRGKDQAPDFFPVSRFRGQFYRPDVVAKVLGTGDEAEALRAANSEAGRRQETVRIEAALPPVVQIVSPPEGTGVFTPSVTLRFAVRTAQDAPVTALRARVNGQTVALPDSRNLAVKEAEPREVTIPIPQADSEIMLFAENRHGVSTPATLRVAWRGQAPPAREEFALQPRLYVLAIGVSKYQRPDLQLELAAKDATDFTKALQGQKGKLYRDVSVKLLTDAGAKKEDILDGLDWIRQQVTAKDVAMVFLAGHGVNDPDGRYYYLPANTDPDRLRSTGVLFHEIRDTLNLLPGKTVLFVDTCHSGNVLGTGRRGADITGVLNELTSAENGVVVFTASTGRQYSLENPAWGNGAFTKAVVEGLLGSADYKKTGRITFKMLDFYISDRVKELTHNQQTPVTIVPNGVPDFPLTLNSARAAVSK